MLFVSITEGFNGADSFKDIYPRSETETCEFEIEQADKGQRANNLTQLNEPLLAQPTKRSTGSTLIAIETCGERRRRLRPAVRVLASRCPYRWRRLTA